MPDPDEPRVSLLTRVFDRALLPGMLGFTKLGHRLARLHTEPMPASMDGRRIVVTGATSGLGLAAARRLASLDADLVLVGRDARKLHRVARDITADTGTSPQTEVADLAVMSAVRALAERLTSDSAPVHVLINNAGALYRERGTTAEGHERSLAVNLMGPFLLTELLIPKLVASAPARIVNVSSGGMYTQRVHVGDLQYAEGSYDGAKAYARAKRGQVILTGRWARELANEGVVVHAMHPGWADTPGVRTSLPEFFRLTRPVLRTAEEGADTIVWLASAETPARTTGGFWLDRRPHETHVLPGTRESDAERDALYDALVDLTDL